MTTHIQRSALLPYPAQALYDLVNDVAKYPEFLPWCSSAEILERTEVLMRASLGVAKGGLSQHFVTRNTLVPGQSIEMNLEEGPFTKLHGVWVFKPLGEKACKISLDMTFDYAGASALPSPWRCIHHHRAGWRRPRNSANPLRSNLRVRCTPAAP